MEVKQGSHQPVFGLQILQGDGKTPVNLTGMTSAVFRMRPANGTALTVTDQPMTVANASLGELFYQWLDGNTATPGRYLAEVQCTFPTGILTVPFEYNRILISPNLQPIGGGLDLLAMTFVRVVEDFGADPTGVGDSTNAFQSAITYLKGVGGGTIFCASGTYTANIALVNVTNINFIASGAVTLTPTNTAADTLLLSGTTGAIQFHGMWLFTGAATGTKASIHIATDFRSDLWHRFEYVAITGGYNAVVIDGEFGAWFDQLEIGLTRSTGLVLTGTYGTLPSGGVNNVHIGHMMGDSPGQTMVYIQQGAFITFERVDIEGADIAFNLQPSVAFGINGVFINNAFVDNNQHGGIIMGFGAGSGFGIYIRGGGSTNSQVAGTSGILIGPGVFWVFVDDMNCSSNAGYGIRIAAAVHDIHIHNCACNSNNQHGVYVDGAATDFEITGTTANSNGGYGVAVAAVAADYYVIQGCVARANVSAPGISDGGTGTHKVVAGMNVSV